LFIESTISASQFVEVLLFSFHFSLISLLNTKVVDLTIDEGGTLNILADNEYGAPLLVNGCLNANNAILYVFRSFAPGNILRSLRRMDNLIRSQWDPVCLTISSMIKRTTTRQILSTPKALRTFSVVLLMRFQLSIPCP
jgi:hypothetical protein